MTRKIDDLTYPDPGREWLKDKTLGPILRAIMRSMMQEENYLFLDAVMKGEKHSSLYKAFIDGTKARHMINISNTVRAPMDAAGKMGNFYDKKMWKDGIKAAAEEIDELVDGNVTNKILLENKAFRAHHYGQLWYNRKNFYKKWKKAKEMKKVEKFLGATAEKMPMNALYDAYGSLKYNPKASKKPLAAVATAIGKTPKEVKSAFSKVIKIGR